MKAEVISPKEQEFTPVTVKVTFESEVEMRRLRDTLGEVSHSYRLYYILNNYIKEKL